MTLITGYVTHKSPFVLACFWVCGPAVCTCPDELRGKSLPLPIPVPFSDLNGYTPTMSKVGNKQTSIMSSSRMYN